jgi:alpha-1,4-digalacturonate transport system permease protein
MTVDQHGAPRRTVTAALGAVFGPPLALVMRGLDIPMKALQRLVGVRHMPYFFLAPNFLLFGLFVFLPIAINIVYSVTGGAALFPSERPYVGAEQYEYLFDGKIISGGGCAIRSFLSSSKLARWSCFRSSPRWF